MGDEDRIARLEAEVAHWKELAQRSSDVISRVDKQGRVTFVSDSVRRVLGWEPSDLVGRMAGEMIDPAERPARREGFERGLREGVAPTVVVRARRKDGSYVWMEYRTEVLRDADGNVAGFQSSSHDVTARQEAQQALERSELNFETFVRAMPVPALLHKEGDISFVNRAYTATFGWSEEAVAGHHVLDFIDPADREYIGDRVKLGVERIAGVPTREHYVLHAKGESVPVEVTVVPVFLRGARCSLAVFRDLRERKQLESQLVTAERMASLGRLAATVGHEINNPLAYVLSSLSLMQRELTALPEDEARTLRELVSNVDEGAHRIRDVVEDLRVFSRERTGELGSIDLSHLLDRAASMASHEVRRRAQLVKSYGELPLVSGNEARLGQVFLNLLVNAAQAIPEGDPAGNEVRIEARTAEGNVEVDVVDTGPGVEPEIAQRIFDPFFTTKAGEGTGLGLSISHHIVVSHGGTLRLVSGARGQTRFRVVLRAGTL